MPKSKHRRKPGVGKSVAHPGRARPLVQPPLSPGEKTWRRLVALYHRPFHERWRDGQDDACVMLDLAEVFDSETGAFQTISKAALFAAFMEPLEDEFGETEVSKTIEDAEAALRFLIEQEMLVVDGDDVAIHPRFPDMLEGSPISVDANGPSPAR